MTKPTSTDDLPARLYDALAWTTDPEVAANNCLEAVCEWLTSDATVERVARALWPFLFVEDVRAALAAALAPEKEA